MSIVDVSEMFQPCSYSLRVMSAMIVVGRFGFVKGVGRVRISIGRPSFLVIVVDRSLIISFWIDGVLSHMVKSVMSFWVSTLFNGVSLMLRWESYSMFVGVSRGSRNLYLTSDLSCCSNVLICVFVSGRSCSW